MNEVQKTVNSILDAIQAEGLDAALRYTNLYDRIHLEPKNVLWDPFEMDPPSDGPPLTPEIRAALDFAIKRIEQFHEVTRPDSHSYTPEPGLVLEEQFLALERVGLYVPNGEYPLLSSLLMTAVPARVAGVRDIVVAVSPKRSIRNDARWLYVLKKLGIHQVLNLGGAQAIGILGYGFKGFSAVDLIAGPGNLYVTEAKEEMRRRGRVGIDVTAGPSEVMVIAGDERYFPVVIEDLLAQAEHGPGASGTLVTWNSALANRVEQYVEQLNPSTLLGTVQVIRTATPIEAGVVANRACPEHLGLMGLDAESLLDQIRTAGAVFVGHMAGQALGDYVAGPSHVLPTGGAGRFQSGLSTATFMRRMSVIQASSELSPTTIEMGAILAELEGLNHHQASLRVRLGTAIEE